ncbi:MAG: hypothetical protein COV72_07735 [Candidatus Omnitrophica bacterium CG11_big_fil_rev_8_21_14_0_20_42_13]|uniref:Fimbrial assembly protein n=1 Tax=Candidatus Ghiorseimicrobium undicola TaxID=1974746 RepID=A0A2H0LVV0_9BACT|nr:MAG: hypothetical protein COV72_07735 [Candidatus Omnitrophica bacterium CG11_big_fil_rev_8_21_14_0_20_42_13]
MENINLLPADLAPPGFSPEAVSVIRRAALVLGLILFVLLFIGIILRFEVNRKNKILSDIMGKIKESDLLAENIEDLRARAGILQDELNNIKGYLYGGLVWSRKLRELSLVMPDEVWLGQLSFKMVFDDRAGAGGQFLNLKGALVPLKGESPIDTLSAFVNKLKQDTGFFEDFSELLITDIRMSEKNKVDTMNFEIRLTIKNKKLTGV